MNPYLAFAIRTVAAFIAGVGVYTSGHTVAIGTPVNWFMLILSGMTSSGAYWSGVVSPNPWAPPGGPKT